MLLLDEPSNDLDVETLRALEDALLEFAGCVLVISHDTGLLDAVVNKVFHLDANRAELDQYALDWKKYLVQRETDEKRRRRERANAERKAALLLEQAEKMGAKATKAVAAQNMARRAEKLLAATEGRAGVTLVGGGRVLLARFLGDTPEAVRRDLDGYLGALRRAVGPYSATLPRIGND